MKWISIEDHIPEMYQKIIIYYPQYNLSKDFMIIAPFICLEILEGVTHWMPLPEPPEVNNE